MSFDFKDLVLNIRYRSGDYDALPKDFYNLVMPCSKNYYRAVGFFTSRCFLEISQGIIKLIKNDGKIKLITSPKLNEEDIEAIEKGYAAKNDVLLNAFEREMDIPETIEESDRLNFLANLIENDYLEIKIAITNNQISSMYHEKIGIFEDFEGNKIVISGSNNESENAISENFESFDVFCSWIDTERVKIRSEDFNDMWNNSQNGLEVIDFPDFSKVFINKYKTSTITDIKAYCDDFPNDTFFLFPLDIKPRQYQLDAMDKFKKNNFQCLYAMATGTGKTLTSLFSVNIIAKELKLKTVLIIVPLKDLVDQWEKDVKKYFSGKIIQIRSGINWKDKIESMNLLNIVSPDNDDTYVIITTYDSFMINYDKILCTLDIENTLIIADEVHKFGAESYSKLLPEKIKYRIGLSATPKRPYDDKGTAAIFDYFCPSGNVFEFTIEDAINNNMLCHYNYYPIIVTLNDFELDDYEIISDKISKIMGYLNNSTNVEKEDKLLLEQLLKQRHRIIERAANKEDLFVEIMLREIEKYKDKTIVFAPDGTDEAGEDYLQKYKLSLWNKLKAKGKLVIMSEYVQGTEKERIEQFAQGAIDILFAKQRLNEGIDIPSAKRAFFIASSTSEREFIQRRGRVLRKAPGKTIAEIYDFIVVPPTSKTLYYKTITENEIKRALDFARTADNFIEIEKILSDYM